MSSVAKTIIPFLDESASRITTASKILAPIGGTEYVHRMNESKRKNNARLSLTKNKSRKRIFFKRIEQATHARRTPPRAITKVARLIPVTRSKKISKHPMASLPTIFSNAPPPVNSFEYQPKEMLSILTPLPDGSSTRSNLIKHFVNEKLIPIKKAQVYSLIQKRKAGDIIKDAWDKRGRMKLLPEELINQIKSNLNKHSGLTIGAKEITNLIQKTQQQIVVRQGRVPITKYDIQPSKQALVNIMSSITSSNGGSIRTSATTKTTTRYRAENSLISATVSVCVVAVIRYNMCTDIQLDIERDVKDASNSVNLLYKMGCAAYGNDMPIFPVRPELILSTDDTAQYIFEGKGEAHGVFRLVASKALEKQVPYQST